ncbi:uncharacterized protein LOC125664426 [Ostrea edulis]|uniref:uncharacterized protein LOC125664426 n=1 Tax=Ostrea edulis TaxID=37623 RepID=UPI002095E10F|nr:uncharacterized protein LOC125664426 [Ostrea edulis]
MSLIHRIGLILCVCYGLLTSQSLGATTSTADNAGTSTDTYSTTEHSDVTTTVNDVMCYSCSDTVRGAECQKNTRAMAEEAGNVKPQQTQEGRSNNVYAKSCKGYQNFTYCMIETIENRGEMHSYRRDCSDGVSFSYDAAKLRAVRPDNQTTCAYNGQGYVICVRLCQRNFCNGPFPFSSANTERQWSCLIVLLVISFYVMFGE